MRIVAKLALLLSSFAGALMAGEHPTPLSRNTTPAECLSCHKEKGAGTSVHSAVSMGCTVCHEVSVRGDKTLVDLTATPEQICFNCHSKTEAKVLHGPYRDGQCIFCHDPHTSPFPPLLRAEGNSLCLECHLERPEVGPTVRIFGKREYPANTWQAIPKISLDAQHKRGHPTPNHPVTGVADPGNPTKKISCLTCHAPHFSSNPRLLVQKRRQGHSLCAECHFTRPGLPASGNPSSSTQPEPTPSPAPGTGDKAQ